MSIVSYHDYKIVYDTAKGNWRIPSLSFGRFTPVFDNISDAYKYVDHDRRLKPMNKDLH